MATVEPARLRSATITPRAPCALLKGSKNDFINLADTCPIIWDGQRSPCHGADGTEFDDLPSKGKGTNLRYVLNGGATRNAATANTTRSLPWCGPIASNYTLDELEEQADFAIAVTHADDMVISRGDGSPAMRRRDRQQGI